MPAKFAVFFISLALYKGLLKETWDFKKTDPIVMCSSNSLESWNGLELNWSEAFPSAFALEAISTVANDGHHIRHAHK